MRLDGYVRVSRVGGRGGVSFISPEVQRDQIEQWAKLHGAELAEVHVDLDESGGKTDRPGFQRMLERVERGVTGGVVVAKLDRFARSLPGALDAIQRLDQAGATFVSVAEGIDPTTPAGKMMHRLMLVLAEFELDRITESWATAQERAVGRGVHFMVPFGYRRPEPGAPLEPDPREAPLVRGVFERRASGESWTDIAAWLNQRTKSPTGGRWVGRTVRHLVDNRVYLGEAYHGRFRNTAAHKPIVTPSQWQAAQGKPGLRPVAVSENLLTGLIRCAGCRYRLKTDRTGGDRTRIYRCRTHHGAGTCPAPAAVTAEIADRWVEQRFLERYGQIKVRGVEATGELAAAQARVAAASADLDAFAGDLRLRGALGHDRFVAQVETRAAALKEAEAQLEAARRSASSASLAVMPQAWAVLEPGEKRKLLRAGIGAVMLRRTGQAPLDRRLHIVWPDELPDDLPGPGRHVGVRSFDWPEVDAREARG